MAFNLRLNVRDSFSSSSILLLQLVLNALKQQTFNLSFLSSPEEHLIETFNQNRINHIIENDKTTFLTLTYWI